MAEFTSSSRVHTPALDAIQQLSVPLNDHKEPLTRLWNGLLTVLIALVAEFLIAGLSLALDQGKSDFPPSILAMMIVFLAIYLCGLIIPGVENFYRKHLLSPVSIFHLSPSHKQAVLYTDFRIGRPSKPPHVNWLHSAFCHDLPQPGC